MTLGMVMTLDITQPMKELTDKLNFIKIKKNFCSVTDSVKRMKKQTAD